MGVAWADRLKGSKGIDWGTVKQTEPQRPENRTSDRHYLEATNPLSRSIAVCTRAAGAVTETRT